ncbi:MAG: hypothetical protein HQL71_01880 [Magnetococcales bacterium]|nr:hypothetical protein [Magnetococcales bacterium]
MPDNSSDIEKAKIIQELINKALLYYENSDFENALQILESTINMAPDDAELHYFTALTCKTLKLSDKWIFHSSKAVLLQTNNHIYLNLLGDGLFDSGKIEPAKNRYKDAINAKSDYYITHLKLYKIYLAQQKYNEAITLLNQGLQYNAYNPQLFSALAEVFKGMNLYTLENYYTKLSNYYNPDYIPPTTTPIHNTFFIKPENAVVIAKQKNRIIHSKASSLPQLCYFLGKKPNDNLPKNLIQIDTDNFIDFFTTTIFDLNIHVEFDPSCQKEREQAYKIAADLAQANIARKQLIDSYKEKCRNLKPEFISGKPLRVMIVSSILTTVMQYNARDLVNGFRKNGCEVLFLIEKDEREHLGQYQFKKNQLEFDPHLIVNINHINNQNLHPDTFAVSWWQDLMPEITEGRQIKQRKRDIVYSIDKKIDSYLIKCGIKNILRQEFCYDEDIFYNQNNKRKNKVVIIASSYIDFIDDTPQAKKLVAELKDHLSAGKAMTDEYLNQFTHSSGLTKDKIIFRYWSYIVRDISVEWLCELSDKIEIEVYGRYWEKNALVKPFYKGELPHGKAVADVYNSAKYTLSPHPFDLGSQRLAEASACGTIPIVYDCRLPTHNINWNNSCLWYRNKEEMHESILKLPIEPVEKICINKSYTNFAKNILDNIEKQLSI